MAPVYEIGVNFENRPKGDEIEVPPFGIVENGGTLTDVEMSAEDAKRYENTPGLTVKETTTRKAPTTKEATTTEGGDE